MFANSKVICCSLPEMFDPASKIRSFRQTALFRSQHCEAIEWLSHGAGAQKA